MEQKKYEIEPKTVEDSQYNTLLACPFCGRSATVEEIDFKIIGVPHYYYECFACKITTPKFSDKSELIERWNARVQS